MEYLEKLNGAVMIETIPTGMLSHQQIRVTGQYERVDARYCDFVMDSPSLWKQLQGQCLWRSDADNHLMFLSVAG